MVVMLYEVLLVGYDGILIGVYVVLDLSSFPQLMLQMPKSIEPVG